METKDFYKKTKEFFKKHGKKIAMIIKDIIIGAILLLYLFSPVDIIPDIIPILGFADDAAFIVGVVSMIRNDVKKYKTLKNV